MEKRDIIVTCILAAVLAVVLVLGSQTSEQPSRLFDVPVVRAQFEESIRTNGGQEAYRLFSRAYEDMPFGTRHTAAHLFGETLYEIEGVPGVVACDSAFDYGCFHGFFIEAVSTEGLAVVVPLDEACQTTSVELASSCQHGIGHGIIEFLGQEKLAEALELCAQIQRSGPLGGCFSGVFMQYNAPRVATQDGTLQQTVRPLEDSNDPYDQCPTLDARFKPACYYSLPLWWKNLYQPAYDRIGKLCDEVPEQEFRTTCFFGLGTVIASSSDFEPGTIIQRCSMIAVEDGRERCLRTAAHSVATRVGKMYEAQVVCAALPLSNQECPAGVSHAP